jgi:uncharacterized Fe-S cluster protein YjdI
MPAVFDTAKRPWVDHDDADAEALAAVIRRCPRAHCTTRCESAFTIRVSRIRVLL